jgi:hypothetical protein
MVMGVAPGGSSLDFSRLDGLQRPSYSGAGAVMRQWTGVVPTGRLESVIEAECAES